MTIDASKQFGVFFYIEEDVEKLAKTLPKCVEQRLEIDFTQCTIDYPATSRIIDVALERLEKVKPPRELVVIFNINYEEQSLLKAFVFGSRLLGLAEGRPTNEQIRNLAIEGFRKRQLTFTIRIVDFETKQELKLHSYG